MGIAKSIEAYTTYPYYTRDVDAFVKHLSDCLNADFILNIYDRECERLNSENHLTAFHKPNRYRLTVSFNESTVENNAIDLPDYELSVPIDYIFDETLEITFFPNNAVQIFFLTFEHNWYGFIETLKFNSLFEPRKLAILRYNILRNEYIPLLKKLDIGSILIITHAYYKMEDISDGDKYANLSFPDILKVAKESDNLTCFDFEQILYAHSISDLSKEFLDKPDLEISLVDNLNIYNIV